MDKKFVANELLKIAKELSQEEAFEKAYKIYENLHNLKNELFNFDKKMQQPLYESDFADLIRDFYINFKDESKETKKELLYPELNDIFSGPFYDMGVNLAAVNIRLSKVIEDAVDRAKERADKLNPKNKRKSFWD